MNGNQLASEFLAEYKALLKMTHAVLVKPGKHPQYFVGFHRVSRKPIFTYDLELAKPFDASDPFMAASWIKHLKDSHGHVVHRSTHHLEKSLHKFRAQA